MTRTSYAVAWFAYKTGDFFEFIGCPTFAAAVDWLYRRYRELFCESAV